MRASEDQGAPWRRLMPNRFASFCFASLRFGSVRLIVGCAEEEGWTDTSWTTGDWAMLMMMVCDVDDGCSRVCPQRSRRRN
jgi:hypothetical protein